MSRRMRRVPPGWEHPRDHNGRYKPLFEGPYSKAAAEWDEERAQWDAGFIRDFDGTGWEPRTNSQIAMDCSDFDEWHGARPTELEYMPAFPEGSATHCQMYEETSEGTPISPVFATPEQLAAWLAENHASAWGGMEASYADWLAMCRSGAGSVGMMFDGGEEKSGVQAVAEAYRNRVVH